jgi:hypothetical protein
MPAPEMEEIEFLEKEIPRRTKPNYWAGTLRALQ